MPSHSFPEAHYIFPEQPLHTHTIIFLHGRNSTGGDFAEELFEGLTSSGLPFASHAAIQGYKWIFPNARSSFSEQFQEELTEWFDLSSTSNPHSEPERQTQGLQASVAYVNAMINEELKSIPANRIILGGISQGFATAICALLSCPHEFGGFIGISGWLPYLQLSDKKIIAATKTPMVIMHSQDDEVIEVQEGREASTALRDWGFNVMFTEYKNGGHEICEPHGYDDLQEFLIKVCSITPTLAERSQAEEGVEIGQV